MLIADYVKQFPDTVFSLLYYFNVDCSECGSNFDVLDEEYSFDFCYSDIGSTGYDWVFYDFDVNNSNVVIDDFYDLDGTVEHRIIITVYGSDSSELCPECSEALEIEKSPDLFPDL